MKKIILFILFNLNFCFGVSLLQYEIFDNADSIDISLSFDSAYKPDIYRSIDKSDLVIALKGVSGDEKFNEMRTNPKILKGFSIVPVGNEIRIVFANGKDLDINAITKNENLTLVLNVKNPNFKQDKLDTVQAQPTQESDSSGILSYIMMALVGLLLLAAIYVIFKRISSRPQKDIDSTWAKIDDENSQNDLFSNLDREQTHNFANTQDEISKTFTTQNFQEEILSQNDTMEVEVEKMDEISDISPNPKEEISDNEENEIFDENTQSIDTGTFKEILKSELEDDEILQEANIILTKRIDDEHTTLVVKFNGKNHLVVLKPSNELKGNF